MIDSRPLAAQSDRQTAPKRWLRIATVTMLLAVIGAVYWQIGQVLWNPEGPDRPARAQIPAPSRQPPFDLSDLAVGQEEILSGGPPKDGIPALTDPRFIVAEKASHLRPDDRVIGVVVGDVAKAYPLAILNYHEIVNDRLGERTIAVTYCPLCDSAAVFDRRTPLGVREFGVSGLLYNSNVLMFDRGGDPESLWSQAKAEGISGPARHKPLAALPMELTTWQSWLTRYPNSVVLSPDTGHARDYTRNPYAAYFNRQELMFPATPSSDRLPAKSRILGVWTEDTARAYPESSFSRDRLQITDDLNGKDVTIDFDPDARSLRVSAADEGVQWMYAFWFAWYAFRPETSVFAP